jgi:6-phospho-3-hexuloisomerase
MVADTNLFSPAIRDLSGAAERIDGRDVDCVVNCISNVRHVFVFGCGREELQIRGFAMRLFHLGRSVSVVGDLTTPAISAGDLFFDDGRTGDAFERPCVSRRRQGGRGPCAADYR